MKLLQFLLLLFRQGSLRLKRIDFDSERNRTLNSSLLPVPVPAKRKDNTLKTFLMNTSLRYSLVANLAYLKNARRMNAMYFVSDSHPSDFHPDVEMWQYINAPGIPSVGGPPAKGCSFF